MTVKDKFEQLTKRINEDPSHLGDMNVVFQFNLDGEDGGTYQLKLSDKKAEISESTIF